MSKYTITSRKSHGFKDGKATYIVTIVVDTEDNIPEPLDEWEPGSMCQIAGTHSYKLLNNEREWV